MESKYKKHSNGMLGKKHSEATKRKISEANKIALKKYYVEHPEAKKRVSEFFKGKPSWNKGLKMSKEHIENLRLAHIGYKHSEETKRKMRGRISISKGKTYEEFYGEEKAKKVKEKISLSKKGIRLICNGWNEGLKMSKEHKKNHSIAMKKLCGENNPAKRLEVRKKISIAKTGKKFPIDKYPNMGVRKMRDKIKIPKKDSSIEIKLQDFLTLLKIEFVTHKYINIKHSYQCDIYIPSLNLIIEADGDFFHMNPNKFKSEEKIFKNGITAKEKWKLDNSRTKELLEKGYNVMRIWENEIRRMTLNGFKNKLMEVEQIGI